MGTEIRPARSAELPAVQRVARAAWYAAHEPIVGEETVEAFLAEYYSRDALAARLGGEAIFLVAVEQTVAGFAVAGPTDDTATYVLGRIYVRPDRWGEGIGQRLLQAVHERARERGVERIRLSVMAENDRAVGFYEAAGYEQVGRRIDERIGAAACEYEREL